MIAIKNWFLVKNHMTGFRGRELEIIKETEKAVLIKVKIDYSVINEWIPKSVITDEWEKDTSNFGYHEYLVNVYHEAYKAGKIENYTIKSGRNIYAGDAFIHQETTKGLQIALDKFNIEYMNREDWNNR